MSIEKKLLEEIGQERLRQIEKGFTHESDDQNKGFKDWCLDIEAYLVWAHQMARMGSGEKYRHRMKQVAALAIAACESFDRRYPPPVDYCSSCIYADFLSCDNPCIKCCWLRNLQPGEDGYIDGYEENTTPPGKGYID